MIDVSVAIIKNAAKNILITQRALDVPHGGLWEMPGGKVEPKETPEAALFREVYEEIGVQVQKAKLIGKIEHAYPQKTVRLHVFHVQQYTGEAACLDGQLALRWVPQNRLRQFDFPEANQKLIKLI
jgi:8-oxo-dGTP diphosphatase